MQNVDLIDYDYKPSGLSQIRAASGLSGDALFGSEIGIC